MVRIPPHPYLNGASPLPEKWRIPLEQGWSCFPVAVGSKRPAISWRAYQTEAPKLEQIEQWAKRPCNVAVCTGAVSGLVVLDLDSDPAIREAERRGLPPTLAVKTAKGCHVYFRHPGGKVRNRTGIFEGADIRGDGGYVIAAGSEHPSGERYEWMYSPADTPLAEMPNWLRDLLVAPALAARDVTNPTAPARSPAGGLADAHWRAAIDAELYQLKRARLGERNDQLNKSTFVLAQMSAGDRLDWRPAEARLREAAFQIGLDAPEIDATIRSAREKGFMQPRTFHGAPAAGCFAPSASNDQEGAPTPFPALDLEALSLVEPHPKQFIIPGLAPSGEVTLLTGPGSAGKSLLAQQLATALAAGVPTLRLELDQANAIYVTCEDGPDQLHWRQAHICAALNVPMDSLAGKLYLVSLRGELDVELSTFVKGGFFELAPAYHRLAALIVQSGAKLVFLDNVAHLFTGNENDRGDVTRFLNALNRLASETGAAIILLGHPNKQHGQGFKSGNQYSGSTAWLNAVRSQITLDHDAETGLRTLMIGKANYGRVGQAIRFFFVNWAFVHAEDAPADIGKAMAQALLAREDDARFLACLRERNRQKRAVSESKNAPTYAPTEFAKMEESNGIGKKRLEAALDRLWKAGKIERAELWKGADRKAVVGLCEVDRAAVGDVSQGGIG